MSSNGDDKKTSAEHPAKHRPKGDYEVGFAKTPDKHRFQPGNNANPKGRPKGSKNRRVMIKDVLFEPITVREGDEIKQMPVLEAVLKKLRSQALAGDKKAAIIIIALAQKEGLLTPEQEEVVEGLSDNDAAIMEDVKRRLGLAQSEHPSEAPAQSPSASAPPPPQPDTTEPATNLPKLTRPLNLSLSTRQLTADPRAQPVSGPPNTKPVP